MCKENYSKIFLYFVVIIMRFQEKAQAVFPTVEEVYYEDGTESKKSRRTCFS